jgi:hypothetical protein
MDSAGRIHYLPEDEAKRRGLHPVPEHLVRAAEEAFKDGVSLTRYRNAMAARWARKTLVKAKNRKRSKIAMATKKRNRR